MDDSNTILGSIKRTGNRLNGWLIARDYRPLWHILCVVAIAIMGLLLFYKHFSGHGTMIYGDMTFPPTLARNFDIYTQTWWQFGSNTNFYNFQRLFWAMPFLVVSKALHFSNARYLFFMFYSTFVLAGVSMYALAFNVVKEMKLANPNRYPIYVGSVVAAGVYMYNPWSLGHFWTYFMYPVYALLPLIFLVTKKLFDSPTVWRVLALVGLLSLGSTMPNTVVWMWLLVVAYAIFYLILNKFAWKRVKRVGLTVLGSMALFLVANSLWSLPYLTAQALGKAPVPWYMPGTPAGYQQLGLDIISRTCSISNNLRLISGWGMPVQPMHNSLWIVLSFALPLAVLGSLILLRKKIARNRSMIFWVVFAAIMILLATGTSFILKRPYSYAVLRAPGSYSLGWIFRAPDRWLIYVPTFFGLAIAALVTRLLNIGPGRFLNRALGRGGPDAPGDTDQEQKVYQGQLFANPVAVENADLRERLRRLEGIAQNQRRIASAVVGILIIVVLVIALVPATLQYGREVYAPTAIPRDYAKVNSFLAGNGGQDGIVWLPFFFVGWHYQWASPKFLIGPYSIYSSLPSINNLQGAFGYYNWAKDVLIGDPLNAIQVAPDQPRLANLATRVLMPFGAKYSIVDSSVQSGDPFQPKVETGSNFNEDESLGLSYQSDFLQVYKTRVSPAKIRVASNTVKVDSFYDNLAITGIMPLERSVDLAFLNDKASIAAKYGVIDLNAHKQYFNLDGDFEAPNSIDGPLPYWNLSRYGVDAKLSIEGGSAASGGRSLKVVNEHTKTYDLAWIGGLESDVQANKVYTVESRIKCRNADWTQVVIEGYKPSSQQWTRLALCPNIQSGTSPWTTWRCSFVAPPGVTKMRPMLAAGWEKDPTKGPAVTWFDDIRIAKLDDSFYSKLNSSQEIPQISYTQISPSKYKVRVVGATKPFVLVFGEAFDPLWTARVPGGKSIDPVPLHSLVNGFPIEARGDYEVIIEYRPQNWFHLGLLISLLAILASVAYLVADTGRRRGWWMVLGPRARDFFGIRPPRERYGQPARRPKSRGRQRRYGYSKTVTAGKASRMPQWWQDAVWWLRKKWRGRPGW